jgi:hypothetical protein
MYPAVAGPRLVRSFVQRIAAPPEEVFPLLCPMREKEWLPGWDCQMIHSRSGVAEPGAVFATAHVHGATVWIITEHDPSRRVAFARWQPDGLVVHIEITLGRHHDNQTATCITYTYTAFNEVGDAALGALTEDAWLATMTFWQESMSSWFANQQRQPEEAAGPG